MKLTVTLAERSGGSEHQLEIETSAPEGEGRCRLDGKIAGHVNWAHVAPGVYSILIGTRSYEARIGRQSGPNEYLIGIGSRRCRVSVRDPRSRRRDSAGRGAAGLEVLTAPMPSKVVKVLVRQGQAVEEGQGLLVTEAMKMQNELRAPRAGRVEHIYAVEGSGVETGAPLVRLA